MVAGGDECAPRRVFRLPTTQARLGAAVDDEFRFHLEERIDELVAQGFPRELATVEARRRFGDVDSYRRAATAVDEQAMHETRRRELVLDTLRIGRQAWRALARSPRFTAAAVLTLAIGLGGCTAVFAMLDAVVLRPLAYPDAHRLVSLSSPVPLLHGDTLWGLARHELFYFKQHSRAFEDLGLYQRSDMTVARDASHPEAERVRAALVSAGIFPVLGIAPLHGRVLTADDNRILAASVVVLGYSFWARRFGRDPSIVGQTLMVNGAPLTVVGIVPATAQLPDFPPVDIWTPAPVDSTAPALNNHTWKGLARLRDGISAADAQRALIPLTARLPALFPEAESDAFMRQSGFYTQVRPLRDVVIGSMVRRGLWVLFGTVLLVLLIATANLSSLHFVRMEGRLREFTLRAAVGAGRTDLSVQLLAENVLLGFVAGLLAVGIAVVALRVSLSTAPGDLPRLTEIHIGPSSVFFAMAGAFCLSVIVGLTPLAWSGNLDPALLRDGGRGVPASRGRLIARESIVVAQVALSLVVLTAAGLMLRSDQNLRRRTPGFASANVLTMRIALPAALYGDSYQRTSAVYEEVARRLGNLPGVVAVGFSEKVPLVGTNLCTGISLEGNALRSPRAACPASIMVSPGYFTAMGIAVDGVVSNWTDMNQHDSTVVVSRIFAKQTWGEEPAIGRGVRYNGRRPPYYRVRAVAADVLADGLDQPPVPLVYFPLLPIPGSTLWGPPTDVTLVVRTRNTDPLVLAAPIDRLIRDIEPGVAVANVALMDDVVAASMAKRTFITTLLWLFAVVALLLSVLGTYSVMSYMVAQRRGDIAIRLALGARGSHIARTVIGRSLLLASAGVTIGAAIAPAVLSSLRSLLFGVAPTNPTWLLASAMILVAVAVLAAVLPASRAAHVDPAQVLRAE